MIAEGRRREAIALLEKTVNEITRKELPALDDEFAKDVSEFSTLKELKADVKKTLTEKNEKEAANADESKLVEAVVANTEIDIPAEMIDEQIDQYVEDFKYQLSYQGLNIDDYFKYTKTNLEQLRAQHKERAEKSVKTRLVFEEIVKAEKIKSTKKEVDAKIADYADKVHQTVEEVTKQLQPQDMYYFENQVITDKLIDLLKKENTIA